MRRQQLNLFKTLRFTYQNWPKLFSSNTKSKRTSIMAPLNPASQVCVTRSLQLSEMTACPWMNLLCPFCHAYYPYHTPASPLLGHTGLKLPCFFFFLDDHTWVFKRSHLSFGFEDMELKHFGSKRDGTFFSLIRIFTGQCF